MSGLETRIEAAASLTEIAYSQIGAAVVRPRRARGDGED